MNEPKIQSISIDVTMLQKELFKLGNQPNKAGKIPQYVTLDVFLFRDGPKNGNEYYVKQSNYEKGKPKEERAEMPIIGNGKIIVGADGSSGGQRRPSSTAPAPASPADDVGDDVPF